MSEKIFSVNANDSTHGCLLSFKFLKDSKQPWVPAFALTLRVLYLQYSIFSVNASGSTLGPLQDKVKQPTTTRSIDWPACKQTWVPAFALTIRVVYFQM